MRHRFPTTVAALLAVFALTGCANMSGRTLDERNQLFQQNQALQQQLDAVRAENMDLRNQLASRPMTPAAITPMPMPAAPVGPATDSGFNQIAGVEVFASGVGSVTVRIPDAILFSPGRADLKDSARKTLDQVAGVLRGEYSGKVIRVEGYTDTDPIKKSGWKDNLELSLQRAASVHRYLASKGVDGSRMYAAGFGQSKPLSSKEKSRRVEIVVSDE
jgi:chemotaxis protein MotB